MAGTAVATVHVAPADVMSGRGVADATWTSSDLRIASVAPATWDDSTATTVVTGYQGGRVTLTAMVRLRDSSTATVTASVVVRAANGMAVWPDTNALVPGVARTLSARDVADGSPYYAPAAGVRWVTDAPDVATVDSTGRVTPHASGRATVSAVRAVTGAGEQRASALVVVRTYPAPLVFRSIVTADPPPTHTDYPYPHSCGLTRDGRAYCWGENATGNLGTAEITDRCEEPVRSIPVEHQRDAIYRVVFSCSTTPVEVGGGHRFTQLSTYALHTCGVTTDGDVYCWGANDSGQAGSGDFATAREPRRADATVRFRSVNAGAGFTCALAESGAAYCWGLNAAGFSGLTIGSVGGLLGTGSSERVVTRPQLVLGGLTFASIAAGDGAVCAVTPAGAAYCWGVGDSGELGTERPATATCASATDTTCYAFALRLRVAPSRCAFALRPAPVQGGLTFREVRVGQRSTCGVTTLDELWCWGSVDLRSSTDLSNLVPFAVGRVPVQITNAPRFAALVSPPSFSYTRGEPCGIGPEGALTCLGETPLGVSGLVGAYTFAQAAVVPQQYFTGREQLRGRPRRRRVLLALRRRRGARRPAVRGADHAARDRGAGRRPTVSRGRRPAGSR